MKRTVIRYGLYAALVIIIIFLASWIALKQLALDYEITEVTGYAGIVLSLLFVFFGIRYYRDQVNGGELTFGRGLKVGLLIVLIPAFAIALVDILYVKFFDPRFYEKYGASRSIDLFTEKEHECDPSEMLTMTDMSNCEHCGKMIRWEPAPELEEGKRPCELYFFPEVEHRCYSKSTI